MIDCSDTINIKDAQIISAERVNYEGKLLFIEKKQSRFRKQTRFKRTVPLMFLISFHLSHIIHI